MATRVNLIFSGLTVLNATKTTAEVGLLSAPEGCGEHSHDAAGHFPMIIVRKDNLAGVKETRPTELSEAELKTKVNAHWLPGGLESGWVAFGFKDHDLEISATPKTGTLQLQAPSTDLGCPTVNGWDDLGWLVNFTHKFPKLVLKDEWEEDKLVTSYIPIPNHGVVEGAAPIDRDFGSTMLTFKFGGQVQAYSDAFVWKTVIDGELTLKVNVRNSEQTKYELKLKGTGGRLEFLILNQPETLGLEHEEGEHVGVVYGLQLEGEETDKIPPVSQSTCPVPWPPIPKPQPKEGEEGGTGSGTEYCLSCLFWNGS